MESGNNFERLMALKRAKKAGAKPEAKPPAAKPLEEAARPVVSDEQPTAQFKVPVKPEQPTREMPVDAAKLAASERAIAEEAQPEVAASGQEVPADDLIEEERPALSAQLPPLPSHEAMERPSSGLDTEVVSAVLKDMLKPLTEKLTALEGTLEQLRVNLFGENADQTVKDLLFSQEEVDGQLVEKRKSLVDVFSGELADLTTTEDVEEIVANAAPAQTPMDLSAIEADVSDLKHKMYLLASDGEVLNHMITVHKDEQGQPKRDGDGNLDFDCALLTLGNAMVIEDQCGKNGELLPVYQKHAQLVIANNLVAKMLKRDLTEEDIADIQETAGECPDASKQILERLMTDPTHMKDVMARVNGSSLEDLDEPDRKPLKDEIEKYLPTMMERAKFFATSLPWDALERRLIEQKETGGDA